jgi:glycosyltransferase involved in cell wall biosynthesis
MAWQPERDAYTPGNGPDPFALERLLAKHGIDALLIDPGRRPWNPLAGRSTVLEALDPLRALRVLLSQRKADIVVSVFEGAALPLTLLRGLAGFRVPIVLWDLGLAEGWRLRDRILDQVVPRADGIFVLSASQLPYIATRWRRRNGVELLGHSIDTTFFTPASPTPDGPILAVGNDAGRDYTTLLEAAEGFDADVVLKTSRLPPMQILPPNVTLRRERISPVALRDLYAGSRFVVVPLHETRNASGISTILEAGAMGLAMVVSDNPAIRDHIVPDETCLVVPCGDASALRTAMTRLLREPETRARLGANARRFVERTCAPSVFAARLAALLRRYSRSGAIDSTTSLDR